jgi:hypothetical protein
MKQSSNHFTATFVLWVCINIQCVTHEIVPQYLHQLLHHHETMPQRRHWTELCTGPRAILITGIGGRGGPARNQTCHSPVASHFTVHSVTMKCFCSQENIHFSERLWRSLSGTGYCARRTENLKWYGYRGNCIISLEFVLFFWFCYSYND